MKIGYVSFTYNYVYPYRPNRNTVFNTKKILNKAYNEVVIRLTR